MSKSKLVKKEEALAHNILQGVNTNIFPVGSCICEGGSLFLYLASNPENIFNIYCTNCEKVYDVRDPRDGPIFFVSPEQQVNVLKEVYGEDLIEHLWNS
jgi:hypothetical protein